MEQNDTRLRIPIPIVVEGRYDKIKIASIADAEILTTDGFSLFHDGERRALLRRMARDGIIILTDPDGGGKQIRSFLSSLRGSERVYHLHIPAVRGTEARKRTAGRAGLLGVEGADPAVLRALLAPFAGGPPARRASLTKADLFADGLSGGEGSAERRRALATRLDLPPDLTSNALLAAINLLCTEEEYRAALTEVNI